MIPGIPAINKLSFSSSGKESRDDPPGLLDLYPLTSTEGLSGGRGNDTDSMREGYAACVFATKRSAYYVKLLRVRRASDNEEVDVFPYRINSRLFGLHPNSLTSAGNTLKEFADGGKTHCVRVYQQAVRANGTNSDLAQSTTGSQPEVTDSNGDCFPLGQKGLHGLNFNASAYGMVIFGLGLTAQHPLSILNASDKKVSSGQYIMGNFMGWFMGDLGNFGSEAITGNFGTNLSMTGTPPPTLDGENIMMVMSNQTQKITTQGTVFTMGESAPSPSNDIKDFIKSTQGTIGSNFTGAVASNQTQYGDFYVGSGFGGILSGPIVWDRTWTTPTNGAREIMAELKEIIGINIE